MSSDIVVSVENVSKKFCKTIKHVMAYGALDITRDFFGIHSKTDRTRSGEFWALQDVSFQLKRGETLGIIGSNGSGKTTLLKLINGIFMPDQGKITVRGKIGALIAVGAGFHPMLTGRENVYVNGQILGMRKKELDAKFDAIVNFSEVGDFIDAPVKHYSSGMFVRLGFAVAVHCSPDILLIDEVLAVGDVKFQKKCIDKIFEIKEKTAVIFISHRMRHIYRLCDRAIHLSQGMVEQTGEVDRIVSGYVNKTISGDAAGEDRLSLTTLDDEIETFGIDLFDKQGTKTFDFVYNEKIEGHLLIGCKKRLENIYCSISLYSLDGIIVTVFNSEDVDFNLEAGENDLSFSIPSIKLVPAGYILKCKISYKLGGILVEADVNPLKIKEYVGIRKPTMGLYREDVVWNIKKSPGRN